MTLLNREGAKNAKTGGEKKESMFLLFPLFASFAPSRFNSFGLS